MSLLAPVTEVDAVLTTGQPDRDAGDDVAPTDAPIEDAVIDSDTDTELPPDAVLEIRAVSPERGPADGDTEILVIGQAFTARTDVFLGGEICRDIDLVDESKIICRTPPNPPGVYDVKVADDRLFASLAGAFTYVPSVHLEQIEPSVGPTIGGMPITISGAGLTADSQVSIGGRLALGVEWIGDGSLRMLTPPGEPGWSAVQVSNTNGVDRVESGFEYLSPLSIGAILPGSGRTEGGEVVELIGTSFLQSEVTSVRFGSLSAGFELIDDEHLQVITPPGPSDGHVDVTIGSRRNGAIERADAFYYFASSVEPSLRHIYPPRGPTSGGTRVVLSGTELDAVEVVTFGEQTALLDSIDPRFMVVESPPSEVPGAVDIKVVFDGSSLFLGQAFTYLDGIDVDSIVPSDGDVVGGTPVLLLGAGFEEGAQVRIGALSASDVEVIDAARLRAVTPPGVVGAADVVVVSDAGLQGRLEGGFTYTSEVVAHGLMPSSGSLAGGTEILIRGGGFVEPMTVSFGDRLGSDVTRIDAATATVRTPPYDLEAFVDVYVTVNDGEPVLVPERYLYFDPLSSAGGVWGDDVTGAVNVTVISENGAPLDGAFVMLGERSEPEYSGYTDANGQVTLSALGLSGPQIVTASRAGFSSSVVYDVVAENVTLVLRCAFDGTCFDDSNCRSDFVCQSGVCLDPLCAGEGGGGTTSSRATIIGQLTGMDKVGNQLPGERPLAAVYTTQSGPWSVQAAGPGRGEHILEDDGPFTLSSRLGSLALVAVCGFYNDETRTFRPIRMGVRRDLYTVGDEVYEIDLECDIWLDQVITVKAVGLPLTEGGPDIYRHYPYLDFGTDGFFGGLVVLEGTSEVLSAEGFAPLEGQLAGLSYHIRGGAYTGRSWPYSISYLREATDVDSLLVLPPFVSTARLTTPSDIDGEVLSGGFLEWTPTGDNPPDFWRFQIRDLYGVTYWDVVSPGHRTNITLPEWPSDADVGLFPSGSMYIIIRGIDGIDFDFDAWDYTDFSSSSWLSYSISGVVVNNP